MATVLITYDLQKNKDYTRLINELKRLGACRPLLSVWVLNSTNSTNTLRNHLQKYVDSDDKLLVVALAGGAGTWHSYNLGQPAVDCMKAHVG